LRVVKASHIGSGCCGWSNGDWSLAICTVSYPKAIFALDCTKLSSPECIIHDILILGSLVGLRIGSQARCIQPGNVGQGRSITEMILRIYSFLLTICHVEVGIIKLVHVIIVRRVTIANAIGASREESAMIKLDLALSWSTGGTIE